MVDTAAGTATVTGAAAFAASTEAQSVGGMNTQFSDPAVAEVAGIDLTDAKILPLADGSGLRFIWQLKSLPAQVPPEGVRYTWSLRIGQTQFQLQAKRTNLGSITTVEDPVGHVEQATIGDYFQLRGAGVANYEGTPAAGCYHLAFLDGAFDADGEDGLDRYAVRDPRCDRAAGGARVRAGRRHRGEPHRDHVDRRGVPSRGRQHLHVGLGSAPTPS